MHRTVFYVLFVFILFISSFCCLPLCLFVSSIVIRTCLHFVANKLPHEAVYLFVKGLLRGSGLRYVLGGQRCSLIIVVSARHEGIVIIFNSAHRKACFHFYLAECLTLHWQLKICFC